MDSTYFTNSFPEFSILGELTTVGRGGGGANRYIPSLKCIFSLSCGTRDRGGGANRNFLNLKHGFTWSPHTTHTLILWTPHTPILWTPHTPILWTPHTPFYGLHNSYFSHIFTCKKQKIPHHGLHKSVGLHA